MKPHHVRKTILTIFGALFIAFGVGAFFGVPGGHDAPHHTLAHNLTHIIAGVLVLYAAMVGESGTRRSFCFAFGAIYLAIGLFGVFSVRDSLRLVPGVIEFHLEDDWVQIATGLLFMALGLLKKVPERSRGKNSPKDNSRFAPLNLNRIGSAGVHPAPTVHLLERAGAEAFAT